MELQTERLILREFSPDDAVHMYLLNLDPEVLRFTGDVAFENIAAARVFLEQYDHYQKYGFGRWAVIRKSDQAWLGWCGLKFSENTSEYDVGFRFFKKYWGQGYATEAAATCLDAGFHTFGMPLIVGRAMIANVNSIRVLQKIGMSWWKNIDFAGMAGAVYTALPTNYTYKTYPTTMLP